VNPGGEPRSYRHGNRAKIALMKNRGLSRRLGASIAAVAIVFAQLAISAYACPGMPTQSAAASMHDADCPEMQSAPTNLCHQACADDPLSPHTASVPALPPAPDTGLRVAHAFTSPAPRTAFIEAPLERATSPPLAITLVRFLK
jgi:hypothetical protein